MVTSLWPLSLPSFFSTVTPGQFPTNWLDPVSALNSVVLPQFGFPANAILIGILSSSFSKKQSPFGLIFPGADLHSLFLFVFAYLYFASLIYVSII